MVSAFAGIYLKRLADADMPDASPSELLAEIRDLLAFVGSYDQEHDEVRVFKPTTTRCGYETPGSVVQVVTEDGPFLVDSISKAVSRSGATIVRHLHPLIGAVRDADGTLTDVTGARGAGSRESIQHFELNRVLDGDESKALEEHIRDVLRDVKASVRDFEPMRARVQTMIDVCKANVHHYDFEEISEAVSFLEWLLDDNYVFLGYREYDIGESEGGIRVEANPESGLGILAMNGAEPSSILLSDLPEYLRNRYIGGDLLVITKTNRNSTVHRDARMDYLGVRKLNDEGEMIAELRMLGLFTSKAYMTPAAEIPVLRRKLRQILEIQDVIEDSHDYKSIVQIFESFPKDDLFATEVEPLSDTIGELIEVEETEGVRVFVRRDTLNRYVSVLTSVPRDRFNAELRKQLQELFLREFGGTAIDYRLALGESGDARIHFSVWIDEGAPLDVDVAELERRVIALARNWDDRVIETLKTRVSEQEAKNLGAKWTALFPSYYKSSTGLEIAAGDILALDELMSSGADVAVGLQNEIHDVKAPAETDHLTRITVYRSSGKLNLSAMMPLMDHLGLNVVEEVPTRVKNEAGTFIHDFGVLGADGAQLDVERIGDRVAAAIEAVLRGEAESDSLHRLVVSSSLTHEELTILRAYRSYWRLVTPSFSVGYVDDTLAAHPKMAEALVRLFEARFAPVPDEDEHDRLVKVIREGLEAVASLDEDRIIRGFLGLILATERTNVHVPGRSSFSMKFSSVKVPDMPKPTPLYEIFVYARDVEGVHLRGGMVARGGIRWSDRREDYRTEVLGLMKAQRTKNVVIVPTGAKGGFVVKRSADPLRPTYDEVRDAYTVFIRGLLDITDNRVGDEVVPPAGVVRHDGDDPYFVVAADKGTASFSDTANAIAAEYGFWLDDAFASGGSAGYDHKALGITARGAWESVRRHFLDLGVDCDNDEITVVGIGDMSGDVFGNGMLISKNLKLVAAFDHRHVFIDPDPDPAASWAERLRISKLERSSWADFDESVISKGGGVFPRSAKSIDLTPEMQALLDTEETALTPSQLIRLVLLAKVDLLWNGGIGTYVKASSESNSEVQDRANDAVRVNGKQLRCRVIGEGGNLGVTQLGRAEFARRGGKVFADFIDNSGGVHASDREVNLKILLRMAEEAGEIDREERDQIIESVSDDVVKFILYDNFLQAQILSQEAEESALSVEAYSDLMDRLEREGLLDRAIEFLPAPEDMAQRAREGMGMTRPEVAVLLSYAKMSLTEHLRLSTLPDDPHFISDLMGYFPPSIRERFESHILQHPLRRELISTIVANQVLNSQGSTYYSRMRSLSGASAATIVRAYRIARNVTSAQQRWEDIEALGASISPDTTRLMLRDVDRLVTLVARWYLLRPSDRSIDEEIAIAADDFNRLSDELPRIDLPDWHTPYERVAEDLVASGVPADLATRHAYQRALRRAPDIVELSREYNKDVLEVAALYNKVSHSLYIGWLERQIRLLPGTTAFERLAIESLREDLQVLRRDVTSEVLLGSNGSVETYFDHRERLAARLDRWHQWLLRDGVHDVSAGLIASRRLRQLLLG